MGIFSMEEVVEATLSFPGATFRRIWGWVEEVESNWRMMDERRSRRNCFRSTIRFLIWVSCKSEVFSGLDSIVLMCWCGPVFGKNKVVRMVLKGVKNVGRHGSKTCWTQAIFICSCMPYEKLSYLHLSLLQPKLKWWWCRPTLKSDEVHNAQSCSSDEEGLPVHTHFDEAEFYENCYSADWRWKEGWEICSMWQVLLWSLVPLVLLLCGAVQHTLIRSCSVFLKGVPIREMRPRELLKSSSPSFGWSGDWVVSWDSLRPPTSPSTLGLGWTPDGGGTCEGTPTLKSVKRVVSSQVGEQ